MVDIDECERVHTLASSFDFNDFNVRLKLQMCKFCLTTRGHQIFDTKCGCLKIAFPYMKVNKEYVE